MYRRLNITLPEDLLGRVDAFAKRERYTRSGLIARALEKMITEESGGGGAGHAGIDATADGVAAETAVAYRASPSRRMAAPRPSPLTRTASPDLARLLAAFFAARDDVEAAWLFGSAAGGAVHSRSDVDVAVLPHDPAIEADAAWDLHLECAARLPGVLGVSSVDVVVLPAQNPLLAHRALVRGVRVFGDHSSRAAELELAAANEYRDSAGLRRALEDRLTERVIRDG